jgi:hypothetical protein
VQTPFSGKKPTKNLLEREKMRTFAPAKVIIALA